jgi:hypothetical protein
MITALRENAEKVFENREQKRTKIPPFPPKKRMLTELDDKSL